MSCFVSFFVRVFLRVAGQNLFIDQLDVSKKVLQPSGLWEESQAPPERDPPIKEITFLPVRVRTQTGDTSYSLSQRLIRLRWKLI
jgi:hypothetical protein